MGGARHPGRFVVHRLNRAEYRNSIRDLLALDVEVSSLLPTTAAISASKHRHRLADVAAVLDGYLTAAQRISTLAVGDPDAPAGTVEYSITATSARTTTSRGCRSARAVGAW